MDESTSSAKGYWFYRGSGNGWVNGGMTAQGKYGIYMEQGYPMFRGTYFMEQSENCIYIAPTADYSTGDAFFDQLVFDFCGGTAVLTSGSYKTRYIEFDHCGAYSVAECINIQNAIDWKISDSSALYSTGGHAIYVGLNVDNLVIANNHLRADASGKSGIAVYNSNTNSNIMIEGNMAQCGSGGYGYDIQGSSIVSWTLLGNQGTINAPGTSSVKIKEHNRDT